MIFLVQISNVIQILTFIGKKISEDNDGIRRKKKAINLKISTNPFELTTYVSLSN